MNTIWSLAALAGLLIASVAGADLQFDSLGDPVKLRALRLECVTKDASGAFMAWGGFLENGLARSGLVGIDLGSGEVTFVGFSKFGAGKIAVVKGADGNVYAYAGSPAHFLRYDINKKQLEDLGVPVKPASYYGSGTLGADGRFYMGSFPTATLVACDTRTGKIENLGRLPTDERQCYIFPSVAVSADGVVYSPVGLHHKELWAYDTRSRQKVQILPPEWTVQQGTVTVHTGTDGKVYGNMQGTRFVCYPDRIEIVDQVVAAPLPDKQAGEESVGNIDDKGVVTLTNAKTKQVRLLQTKYEGQRAMIFSVACERDGLVYGCSLLPGNTFTYDTRSGALRDLGVIDSGKCQVYDMISLPQGLLLGSYMGAWADLYDPSKPLQPKVNPRQLGRAPDQERPIQWCAGPEGMIYTGTEPAKGRLGGALMRVDPRDGTIKVWPTPIANQSLENIAYVPETGELFITTSIAGGSSAKPTEKSARVFLWDLRQEKLVWQGDPLPDTTSYRAVVRAANGKLYGVAGSKYYVFDPVKRETVKTGDLPVQSLRYPQLADEPVGGLIYGLGDDAVFAIDPSDDSVKVLGRHPSLAKAHGFFVNQEGILYYGSGATLWRCKLQ